MVAGVKVRGGTWVWGVERAGGGAGGGMGCKGEPYIKVRGRGGGGEPYIRVRGGGGIYKGDGGWGYLRWC